MGSLATAGFFPGVPTYDEDEERHRRQIAVVLNNVLRGKTNNTSTVTLTANSATTTLTDERIGATSTILLHATTANAAAALGGVYFSAFADGSCTVNHANDAQNDKTFRYAVVG